MSHRLLRLLLATCHGSTCRQCADHGAGVGLLSCCCFRPRHSLGVPTGKIMCASGSSQHIKHIRVTRAQSDSVGKAFECCFGITEINLHPSSFVPGSCQVRVELEGLVDQSCAIIEVANNIGKSGPSPIERDGIVPAEF